ncbi:stage III sporulation protein SpoIIIAB [Caldibacillus lycopersici]|uniref:Stage III sporulation protein SpoIIIAB n=1 Tax=Perspicuibacillus lycopersici TaxID=1325689 RepID=A0AAE3LNG9_9BACI|nr:stage III sporulation protein SpoIIIAB [Perspicuibacillus lycopersici]MCU9613842.1 stage III sporulation protein SpoIIIAB [Perspicuibacillus lycopersici]
MMKILGALIILVATSWIGFEASRLLTERTRQLRLLKSALQSLEAEIMFGHAPLHEASRRIAKQIDGPVGKIFKRFATNLIKIDTTAKVAWEESLNEVWKQTALKKGEYEILLQFGETLGRHDRVQQQKQIRLALTHLEREEVEARDKQLVYGKMVKNLGVLSGILIIILLI